MPGREPVIAGEFDWSLGADLEESAADCQSTILRCLYGDQVAQVDLAREAMLVGVVNRLFYRNAAGRIEAKLRPGPRIAVADLVY